MKKFILALLMITLSQLVIAEFIGQYIVFKDSFTVAEFKSAKNWMKDKSKTYQKAASMVSMVIIVSTNTVDNGLYHWRIGKPLIYDETTKEAYINIDERIETFQKFQNYLNDGKIFKVGHTTFDTKNGWNRDKDSDGNIYDAKEKYHNWLKSWDRLYEVEIST